jgi:teneurin
MPDAPTYQPAQCQLSDAIPPSCTNQLQLTSMHSFQGQMPDRSAILVESQAVQESLPVSDNNIFLVYHSARTKGYLSTIQLQLTPETIPSSLVKVHLKITIEGVVHEKVFEADPYIRYTYSWDRLNEYRQVCLCR